jgi:cytochrome b6-f complex iron-sulfur subunit
MSTESTTTEGVSRREFLSWFWLGWITFTVILGSMATLLLRFLFPNVLFEKPSKFRAGLPSTYQSGVDERFKDTQKVWIVNNNTELYALSAICTHLGCTPNWLNAEGKFKCPCHGSGFRPSGLNFEGPAPRPLERFALSIDDSGQLVVDKSRSLRQMADWENPEFKVKI